VIDDPPIDYAKMAESYGLYAEGSIVTPNALAPALARAINAVKSGRPALVDVVSQGSDVMSRSANLAAVVMGAAALLGTAFPVHPLAAQASTTTGDAHRGKVAFLAHGCEECHGTVGQGNPRDGVRIAPHPVPYAAFIGQLRKPRAQMPPYDVKILSDNDAANIYAYLTSIPSGKAAADIPVLASVDTGNAGAPPRVTTDVVHGRAVFAQNCASCHGADGRGGGLGPALIGEKTHKDLSSAIAFIKNPTAPMPTLYPSRLSERDVADVAAYVESL
jgi:mono/diheme cytochrome c family protein